MSKDTQEAAFRQRVLEYQTRPAHSIKELLQLLQKCYQKDYWEGMANRIPR